VLFLRRFGRGMRARATAPAALLGMLAKLAALLPTQTRRSEESQSYQQFSTPIGYAFVASIAAAITADDLVLEPSAGTGLLAIFAELAGAGLALNELASGRADLLAWLFPGLPLTRQDAGHIDDHLDPDLRPTVVLMNPPFSTAAHVEGRVADAAFRHVASALARLADGGRLVAITGASLSPDNSAWRDGFVRLQERGRIVFSAAVSGSVYARHGTTNRHASHGHRPCAGRRPHFVSGVARSGIRSRDAARVGHADRAASLHDRVDTRTCAADRSTSPSRLTGAATPDTGRSHRAGRDRCRRDCIPGDRLEGGG
jgi:predicted RNA methylase